MCSSFTGRVLSKPATTLPTESPTRTMSTPESSTTRAKSTSYAVTTTSFCPSRFMRATSRSVIRFGAGESDMMNSADLLELPPPEVAIAELGMRNRENIVGELLVLDHHNVEIQRARAPTHCAY